MFDLINHDEFYSLLEEEVAMYDNRGTYEDSGGEWVGFHGIIVEHAEFEIDGEYLAITIWATATDDETKKDIGLFQRIYISPSHLLGEAFELDNNQWIGEV